MVKKGDGRVGSAEGEVEGAVTDEGEKEARAGLSVPVAVAGLSWWMLLMTAAYFHTWFEKVGHDWNPHAMDPLTRYSSLA